MGINQTGVASREFKRSASRGSRTAGFDKEGLPDMAIEEAAKAHGTPLYLLDMNRIRANHQWVANAFPSSTLIAYSYKTNYLPAICRELLTLGAGAEVVSGMELGLALAIGVPPGRIVFNGPVKEPWALELAITNGIRLINVETIDECAEIGALAQTHNRQVNVGVRVRPEGATHRSPDPTYQGAPGQVLGKFGWRISTGEAMEFCRAVAEVPGLSLTALHCHLGSRVMGADPYVQALDRICALIRDLRRHRIQVATVDLGGGFAPPRVPLDLAGPLGQLTIATGLLPPDHFHAQIDDPFPFARLAEQLQQTLVSHELREVALVLEPGRALVQDTMALVTTVRGVKRTRERSWLFVDTGIHHLPLAETGKGGFPIRLLRPSKAPLVPWAVAGPLCIPGDYFTPQALLPEDTARGDILVIENAGAYSFSRAFPFQTPRPLVVAWDGQTATVCWRRESWQEVFRFASLPAIAEGVQP